MASASEPEPPVVHAPHEPLAYYDRSAAERAGFLRRIFDDTAPDDDRIERYLALGSGPWYRRQALLRAGLAPGMRVVDVGFGTGLVAQQAITIIGGAALLTGVDPSPGMMGASPLASQVRLVEGRAEAIPLPDASADFISMGYALRHIGDVQAAFASSAACSSRAGACACSKSPSRKAAWARRCCAATCAAGCRWRRGCRARPGTRPKSGVTTGTASKPARHPRAYWKPCAPPAWWT